MGWGWGGWGIPTRLGVGVSADATNILTVTSSSTTDLSKALNITHTGAITGTGYGGYFSKTGASTTNVGLYATASGATNNYAAIFESGSVGVGTTAPGEKLEVQGNVQIGNPSVTSVGLLLTRTNAAIKASIDNFISAANSPHLQTLWGGDLTGEFTGNLDTAGNNAFLIDATPVNDEVNFAFAAPPSGTSFNSSNIVNVMTLKSSGNVGIGTVGFGTSAVGIISLGAGTAPTTSPANVTQAWTADWNGAGTNALFIRTEEGTQHVFGSNVSIGHITPDRLLHPEIADATTAAVSYAQRLSHVVSTASTGSSDGFGVGLEFELETGTDLTNQVSSTIESVWATAANATRKGRLNLYAYDTAARLGLTVEASGTAAMLGFYGVTAVVRPTALTTQLTSITHTSPGTPDYALQNLVQNTGFGFVTADEGNTFLSVVLNLQTRVSELETKLIALGLLQ